MEQQQTAGGARAQRQRGSGARLDRQARPTRQAAGKGGAAGKRQPPQRVPETQPPLLGDWFIYLSIVVLVCGVVAITALEFGQPLDSALVRLPMLLAGVLLVVLAADAIVRVWRSAWAWLPVDHNRGLFRFVWVAALLFILLATLGGMLLVLTA